MYPIQQVSDMLTKKEHIFDTIILTYIGYDMREIHVKI